MGIFRKMGEVVGSLWGAGKANRAIKKDDVVQACQTIHTLNAAFLQSVAENSSAPETKTLLSILGSIKDPTVKLSYNEFRRRLPARIQATENSNVLGAIVAAVRRLDSVLDEIRDNVDKLFKEKEVTLSNTRMSQMAVFQIIFSASVVVEYGNNLIDYAKREYLGTTQSIPKYRIVYMSEYAAQAGIIVGSVLNQAGNYSFLQGINEMRSSGADILLVVQGNPVPNDVDDKYYATTNGAFGDILNPVHIGMFIRNAWDSIAHTRYLKAIAAKEYATNQSLLFRQKMQGTDPDSEEYQKLAEIAKNYDIEITKYDAKINKYLEAK